LDAWIDLVRYHYSCIILQGDRGSPGAGADLDKACRLPLSSNSTLAEKIHEGMNTVERMPFGQNV